MGLLVSKVKPRGGSLFPHLANTSVRELLLETLARLEVSPPGDSTQRMSDTPFANPSKREPVLSVNDSIKKAAPKIILDDGYVYKVTHYPKELNGTTNNKCWVKKCLARITYNLATKEIVRNGQAHLGAECGVDKWLASNKKKTGMEKIEDCVAEMVQNNPFVKPDAVYQQLLREGAMRKCSITPRHIRYLLNKQRPKYEEALEPTFEDPYCPGQSRLWVRSDDRKGIIVFMTDRHEKILHRSQVWQVDATFQCCPNGWLQLLNIMTVDEVFYEYLPAAHILMKGKSVDDYKEAFLRLLVTLKNPNKIVLKRISTDFEVAMKQGLNQALEEMNLSVTFSGCLFHYAQALLRQWKAMHKRKEISGLQWMIFNVLMAFPYIPIEKCEEWFKQLKEKDTGCEEFVAYFDRQWMKNTAWWHHEYELSTNCALEGFHGNMKRDFAFNKPSLQELSMALFKIDMDMLAKLEQREKQTSRPEKPRKTVATRVNDNMPLIMSRMERILKQLPDKQEDKQCMRLPKKKPPKPQKPTVKKDKEETPVPAEEVTRVINEFLASLHAK